MYPYQQSQQDFTDLVVSYILFLLVFVLVVVALSRLGRAGAGKTPKPAKKRFIELERHRGWRRFKVTYVVSGFILVSLIMLAAYNDGSGAYGYDSVAAASDAFYVAILATLIFWALYRFAAPALYGVLKHLYTYLNGAGEPK
jgi:hypothetical protein